MKNCGRIHQKRTKIDRLMNKLVMLVRGLPWALGRDGGGDAPAAPAATSRPSVSLLRRTLSLIPGQACRPESSRKITGQGGTSL